VPARREPLRAPDEVRREPPRAPDAADARLLRAAPRRDVPLDLPPLRPMRE
jgi:hypothetical protein